jgi:RND family efflux transporter MFP subunit
MRSRARNLLVVLLIAAAFAAGLGYERWRAHRGARQTATAAKKAMGYHCPMHPNFRSDKPGDCGICGMKLVPDEDPSQPAPASDKRAVLYYRDPHDPNYKAHVPGLNPETGKELVPVYAGDAGMPPGTVHISPEKQQLIGVRYGVVEQDAAARTIRANGRVAADETKVARVQTKIEGWIEKIYVDFVGKSVRKGEPLLTLYSPEMLATQQEYLLAIKTRDILRKSTVPALQQDSNGVVEAARRRLELWDLSEAQIKQIEQTGKPLTNITLHSPTSGYVTQKNALPNQRITPETELYTIVDLSRVWVMADVYEYQAGSIRIGQRAAVRVAAYPGRSFPATVSYIQPQINPETRTLQVRLEMSNPNLLLKPEMFVTVDLAIGASPRVVVPLNAVLNSGLRQTVFVDRGNGYLEPRRVRTGQQFGDRMEILEGLNIGERIVTSGTFLIDSESQLQSAASGMVPQAPQEASEPPSPPATPRPMPDSPGSHKHD